MYVYWLARSHPILIYLLFFCPNLTNFIGKKAASLKKCHIVTVDWLVECINTKKAVAEKAYLIAAASAVDKQKDQQTTANPVNESDKKRKIKDEDEEEQVETNKKQKDSQRASFKATLNVPVDEDFQLKSPFPHLGKLFTLLPRQCHIANILCSSLGLH